MTTDLGMHGLAPISGGAPLAPRCVVRVEIERADGSVERAEGSDAAAIWKTFADILAVQQHRAGVSYSGPKLRPVKGGRATIDVETPKDAFDALVLLHELCLRHLDGPGIFGEGHPVTLVVERAVVEAEKVKDIPGYGDREPVDDPPATGDISANPDRPT